MSYADIADLSLQVESVDFERRERETSSGFTRATTVITLSGDGVAGRGEDVTYEATEHDPERWERLERPTGSYTLDSFSEELDGTALFPTEPDREAFHHYRRWGFESAALDLALRQTGASLGEQVGRTYDPVRFVVSTRLSDVEDEGLPTPDRVERWLEIDPGLGFKLDPGPGWDRPLVDALAATDAVEILDLKAHYEGTSVDNPPDPTLYELLVEAFHDAVIEDPGVTDETRPILAGHEDRISWDSPITGVGSIEDLPFEPQWLNIKPSRFGTVESLFETLEYCAERDVRLYGGGQFELDVGRTQIQTLASLFYPDGPNDVAPGGYNAPKPTAGLPSSPLDVPDEAGFGWQP